VEGEGKCEGEGKVEGELEGEGNGKRERGSRRGMGRDRRGRERGREEKWGKGKGKEKRRGRIKARRKGKGKERRRWKEESSRKVGRTDAHSGDFILCPMLCIALGRQKTFVAAQTKDSVIILYLARFDKAVFTLWCDRVTDTHTDGRMDVSTIAKTRLA